MKQSSRVLGLTVGLLAGAAVILPVMLATQSANAQTWSNCYDGGTYSGFCYQGTVASGYEGIVITSTNGAGINANDTGNGFGVEAFSNTGVGVLGGSTSLVGVQGNAQASVGVYGIGAFSSTNQGVYGASHKYGVYGTSTADDGVNGNVDTLHDGVTGINSDTTSSDCTTSGYCVGVKGSSTYGYGVYGTSTDSDGVYGTVGNGNNAVAGINSSTGAGVWAQNTSTGYGLYVSSTSNDAIYATSAQDTINTAVGNFYASGTTTYALAVQAEVNGTGTGVYASLRDPLIFVRPAPSPLSMVSGSC
jgi:hypothetical protein